MSDHTIALLTLIVLVLGVLVSCYVAFLNRETNQIQNEQTREYKEQTEVMRADALGGPVPARVYNLPSATVQLSWLRRQGAKPFVVLAAILLFAAIGALTVLLRSPQSIQGTTEVPANQTQLSVPVTAKPPYEVIVTANWNSTVWVTKREDGQFVLSFGAPAPKDAEVDWQLIPIAESTISPDKIKTQLAEQDQQFRILQDQVAMIEEDKRKHDWPVPTAGLQQALTNTLRGLGPHPLEISCEDDHCEALSDALSKAAKDAAWSVQDYAGGMESLGLSGIQIQCPPDQGDLSKQLQAAVHDALDVPIEIFLTPMQPPACLIAVGRKPRA